MRAYRALFAAGFQRQATYRLALVSGLATNVFFGIIRTALFVALYEERGSVGGLDRAEALTYVWVVQALSAWCGPCGSGSWPTPCAPAPSRRS